MSDVQTSAELPLGSRSGALAFGGGGFRLRDYLGRAARETWRSSLESWAPDPQHHIGNRQRHDYDKGQPLIGKRYVEQLSCGFSVCDPPGEGGGVIGIRADDCQNALEP